MVADSKEYIIEIDAEYLFEDDSEVGIACFLNKKSNLYVQIM